MSQFEPDLREAFRRREAPAGFEERVLARVRDIDRRREARSSWAFPWRWAAITTMLCVLIGGFSLREYRRQAEAQKSKEQLLFALRITGFKLRQVQEKINGMEQKTIEVQLQQ